MAGAEVSMTVRRYMVWDDTLGTAAARPYLRLITCDSGLVADQPFDVSEAYDIAPDAFTPEEDDDTGDADGITYTIDTTVTPKTVTAVPGSRFTLAEREDIARRKINRLLAEASTFAMRQDARLTEAELAAWLTYCDNVRALLTDPGFPDSLVYPTRPAIAGTDLVNLATRAYRRGNIRGAVSLSGGGVPTAALAEMGANANGLYWKFTDGVLVMSHRLRMAFTSSSSMSDNWIFPHVMSAVNINRRCVQISMSNRNNLNVVQPGQLSNARMADLTPIVNTVGQTSINIILFDRTTGLVSGDFCWVELFAMGRWDEL